MGSIFNYFFLNKVVVDLVNSALCNSFAWTVRVIVHGHSKKKKANAEARRKTQTHTFSICLDRNYLYLRFEFCVFLFFSFFGTRFRRQISLLRLLFMYCSWIVVALFDFSATFQHINGSRALFTGLTNLTF